MNYEIVELKEKKVVGITARTSNQDPNMGQVIGTLWTDFFQKGIYQGIDHKANACSIGLYSNYDSTAEGAYDITVGCEVSTCEELAEGIEAKTVFAGKYAKFIVKGHVQTAVGAFWMQLCELGLDRKYDSDFEEYQEECDPENSEIHIYISLND